MTDYQKRASRVVEVDIPHNIRRSGAINIGLNKVTEEYLLFQDADDSLPINSVKSQFDIAEKFNSDIVFVTDSSVL